MDYLFPPIVPCVPIAGSASVFPVHRIYCVGRNYVEHAQEMGATGREPPFFFMKPADAVLPADGHGNARMPYPSMTQDLHHELELVVAIGRGGVDIAPSQALDHVYGYAVGLDMTRRDLQSEAKKLGRPWCTGKGFDASAPIGAIQAVASGMPAADALISLSVNGQPRQESRLDKMIWNVAEIIAQLSRFYALQRGDLIYTGTPAGVAAVTAGDELCASVEGLPSLTVHIT